MKAKIAQQHYFVAGEALAALGVSLESDSPLNVATVCMLVMKNGFMIFGISAPSDHKDFDPEKGKRLSYEDAVKKLWPLEGYALRERLAA